MEQASCMEGSVAHLIQFETVRTLDACRSMETSSLIEHLSEARSYLHSFPWLSGEVRTFVGAHFDGILTIFLFEISPKFLGVDDFLWVIVGDIPIAYITVEDCPNPATALDGYIGAMQEWVSAALNGEPTENLIPVDATPNARNGLDLKSRLEFLDSRILLKCPGDLDASMLQ